MHGTRGSFTKFGLDAQEEALKAGLRPSADNLPAWGLDPQPGEVLSWDTIPGVGTPVSVRRPAPNPPGNYPAYYARLRDHLWGLTPAPMVTAAQIRAVMQILALGQPAP
jgi:hypothetical protein